MEQNFPKGGRSNLSQLIEQCVSQFKDVEKYKNDPRYLDIWVKFVSTFNSFVFGIIDSHLFSFSCSQLYLIAYVLFYLY